MGWLSWWLPSPAAAAAADGQRLEFRIPCGAEEEASLGTSGCSKSETKARPRQGVHAVSV